MSNVVEVLPHLECNKVIVKNRYEELPNNEEYFLTNLFNVNNTDQCDHRTIRQPKIKITQGSHTFCGLIDTGSEISLVTESCLGKCLDINNIVTVKENTTMIGVTGACVTVSTIAYINIDGQNNVKRTCSPFVVVPDKLIPACFLLGADYLIENELTVDFSSKVCKRVSVVIGTVDYDMNESNGIVSVYTVSKNSASFSAPDNSLRFKFDNTNAIVGIDWLLTHSELLHIQRKSYTIKYLKKTLIAGAIRSKLPKILKPFGHHLVNCRLVEDLVVINVGERVVPVVTFEIIADFAVMLHYELAHVGRDKVLKLITEMCWHPKMYKIVNDVCTTCSQCQLSKITSSPIVPPTLKINTSYPFEMVAVDLVSLPISRNGNNSILVMVDHYSKWVSVVPLINKKSCTVVKALNTRIFPCLPRVPCKLLSDNGPEFRSSMFETCLESWGVKHIKTTPNKPSSAGIVERANKSISGLLLSLQTNGRTWDESLPRAVMSYNNTVHRAINMSPSSFLLVNKHSVSSNVGVSAETREVWRTGHKNFQSFKLGSKVVKRRVMKGRLNTNKLEEKYEGPFVITKIHGNRVTYELKNNGKIIRAHHSQLKRWYECPSYLSKNMLYRKFNVDTTNGVARNRFRDGTGEDNMEVEIARNSLGCSQSSDSDSNSDLIVSFIPQISRWTSGELERPSNPAPEAGSGAAAFGVEDDNFHLYLEGACVGCSSLAVSLPVKEASATQSEGNAIDTRADSAGDPLLPWEQSWELSFDASTEVDVTNDSSRIGYTMESTDKTLDELYNMHVQTGSDTDIHYVNGSNIESTISSLERTIDEYYDRYVLRAPDSIVVDQGKSLVKTRSRGPVQSYPNVQPRILERKTYGTK
jgi:hypothetical protein